MHPQDIGLKQRIFADLESSCSPNCILATNTSTIDIELVGEKTRSQDRIVGAHFFSPAHVMPLLEIVRTKHTSPQVTGWVRSLGEIFRRRGLTLGCSSDSCFLADSNVLGLESVRTKHTSPQATEWVWREGGVVSLI